MSLATTARVIGTTFTPSLARPVFVAYQLLLTVGGAGDSAIVELRTGLANPPTSPQAQVGLQTGSVASIQNRVTLIALVLPGHNVRLVSTLVGGGTATLLATREMCL